MKFSLNLRVRTTAAAAPDAASSAEFDAYAESWAEGEVAAGPGILSVEGLQKSYGGRTVVHDAGLIVRQGEAVGLLGPNGAGKT
ncbi:MAG: transporter related protein, partial [Enterovirga sp.]|nr:transporter related protein [Enterovirga sp.]